MAFLAGMLLALLSDTCWQSHALAADAFRDRTAAQRRLAQHGPLALPSIACASLSRQPERRRRAMRLLAPWLRRWEQAEDSLLLLWLLHDPEPKGRWIAQGWQDALERMPLCRVRRLAALSRSWGCPGEDWQHRRLERHDADGADRWWWAEAARRRAQGLESRRWKPAKP